MNDLGHDQILNSNRSLKLVLICGENHQQHLLQYFNYLGQIFNNISFIDSLSSDTKDGGSHLDHTITFEEFISSDEANPRIR